MSFSIRYHPLVLEDDVPSLGKAELKRIEKAIEDRLMINPEKYGKPLQQGLRGFRRLRVGDFRIIYRVVGSEIRVLKMGHRSEVYRDILYRLN